MGYENDAFAIPLPFSGLRQSRTIAERVRRSVEDVTAAMDSPNEATPPLTVSISFADLQKDDTLASLLGRAVPDLRQAQTAGGERGDSGLS